MELRDLTQFVIESIHVSGPRVRISGRVSDVGVFRGVGDDPQRARGSLYYSATCTPLGDLVRGGSEGFAAEFQSVDGPIRELEPGVSCAWIDFSWNARDVTKILDHSHRWDQVTFEPTDAVASFKGTWHVLRKRDAGEDAENIVKAGWDHEHCELCGRRIGVGGETAGFVDDDEYWLCERCYVKYAKPHDLAFLIDLL